MEQNKAVRTRRRRGFNFIDAVLVLIILLLVAILITAFAPFSSIVLSRGDEVTLEYTVEVRNVSGDIADQISTRGGYPLLDASTQYSLGDVALVDTATPYTVLTYNNATASAELTEYPDRYNVQITVSAPAIYRAGVGYTVNGYRIAVGKEIAVRCAEFTGTGYCISMSVAD